MKGDALRAGRLRGVKEFKGRRRLGMGTEPRLQGHGEVGVRDHGLEEPMHLRGILHEGRAGAALRHLLHRTARVQVDLAEARPAGVVLQGGHDPRCKGDLVLVRAEDLTGDGALARQCLHQVTRRPVRMRERGGGHHLGIGEIGTALLAHQAERGVGESGQRSENVFHGTGLMPSSTGSA